MFARGCFKITCLSLLIFGLALVSVNISRAQLLPAISGINNVDLGSVKIIPFVQAGYKNIGLSLGLPFVNSNNPDFNPPPSLDLSFQDAGVWVGSVGLDTRFSPRIFVDFRAAANAAKNISVVAGEDFLTWIDGAYAPLNWSGSQFQWWDVDGMAGYNFYKDCSAVLGLRYDYLTVGLKNPVDAQGNPLSNYYPGYANETDFGDVVIKTWIPYIGVQLNARNYKALLIYSPLASPKLILPQRSLYYRYRLLYSPWVWNANLEWNFARTGSFLECSFEYDAPVFKDLQLGIWVKGTWMKFIGSGNWDYSEYNTYPLGSASMDGSTGTLRTSSLGGGIAASLSF